MLVFLLLQIVLLWVVYDVDSSSTSFTSLFTAEMKPIASLTLQTEMFIMLPYILIYRKSIYICDAQSIYLLTEAGEFLHLKLEDEGLSICHAVKLSAM